MTPRQQPLPSLPAPLDSLTLRELARRLSERLAQVNAYSRGGCPACHDGEARAFLAQLHRAIAELGDDGSR